MATADRLIEFESGDLSPIAMLHLFADLVQTGVAWRLQGFYGRTAHRLIGEGWLSEDGQVNPLLASSLCDVARCPQVGHHVHLGGGA